MLFGDIYDTDDLYELSISELSRKDELGNTLLHLARTPQVVSALIELGAKVNIRNKVGKTPLHYAKNVDVVNKLIYYYADIDAGDDQGLTLLHTTSSSEITLTLLEHGADVNVKDYYGRTPLHTCNNSRIARILLQHDADILENDTIEYYKKKIQKFVPNILTKDLLEFNRLISILSVISHDDEYIIYTDIVMCSLIRENVRLIKEIDSLRKTENMKLKKRKKRFRWF